MPPGRGRDILLTGSELTEAAQVIVRLQRDGHRVFAGPHASTAPAESGECPTVVDGVILSALSESPGTRFLDLSDADFAVALDSFAGTIAALQQGLLRVRDGGSLVLITSRGFLGGWGGAHEMAFSAATIAMTRSVALESMGRRVRANAIAVELAAPGRPGGAIADPPPEIADLVAFLLADDSRMINGEVILANAGRSLTMREARDRR